MPSKTNLALGTAFAAIALFCFMESSFAQDALVASIAASDNDDTDADDKDDKDDKSRRRSRSSCKLVGANTALLISSSESLSLALTDVSETTEVESVVVTGSFEIYPVEYPALPPVEGTRINVGKKTSFVKPKEFPTLAG